MLVTSSVDLQTEALNFSGTRRIYSVCTAVERERRAIAKELVAAHVAKSQRRQKENYNFKTSPHHRYSRGDLI